MPAGSRLARIPDDARLEDATDDQLDAAAELLTLLEEAKQVGRGKVTKVLHKKRPAFIPIIDSVVGDFLWKNFPWLIDGEAKPGEVLTLFRTVLVARSQALASVQANLAAHGFPLTTVRVLDYLIWLGWRGCVDRSGLGPSLHDVWQAASTAEARRVAEESWRRAAPKNSNTGEA
jgi:hypothetical protein